MKNKKIKICGFLLLVLLGISCNRSKTAEENERLKNENARLTEMEQRRANNQDRVNDSIKHAAYQEVADYFDHVSDSLMRRKVDSVVRAKMDPSLYYGVYLETHPSTKAAAERFHTELSKSLQTICETYNGDLQAALEVLFIEDNVKDGFLHVKVSEKDHQFADAVRSAIKVYLWKYKDDLFISDVDKYMESAYTYLSAEMYGEDGCDFFPPLGEYGIRLTYNPYLDSRYWDAVREAKRICQPYSNEAARIAAELTKQRFCSR